MTALVHVWVTLPDERSIPDSLRHSLSFVTEDGLQFSSETRVALQSSQIVVGRPFRTGTWLAHNGPGNHRSSHWGSALLDDRGSRIPQRYAIDFIGVDDNGTAVRGDFQKSQNGDWIGFGRDIVAVVDGTVYAARDGIPDNRPLVEPPPPSSLTAADTYGNYVILSRGDGIFIHYAHLQHNSVAVKTGQTIRRGQVLGRLGNSGNTNGPHLHFNVTNDPSPATAEGLPFVFDAFESLATTTAAQAIGAERSPVLRFSPMKRGTALPLDGVVVRFP
jgi:murein DD-endopeptidase MepM/ murein hydrolase activator NlpD